MAKRIRKKRPKRSSLPRRDQQLRKRVQELYTPGETTDEDWADDLGLESSAPGRPSGRPNPTPASSAQAAEGRGSAEETADESTALQTNSRRGEIVTLFSGISQVESEGDIYECVLPSRLAQDQQSAVAVGDRVMFAAHGEDHRIVQVLPRDTFLSRPDPHNPRLERVVAANVDVVVQVASVVKPPLRLSLIDRYLIAIERGGAKPLLCVNKIDLLDEKARLRELGQLDEYRHMGLEIFPCSAQTNMGIDAFLAALSGKTAVFVGHSGVGKSSLLMALAPDLDVATGQVSQRYSRGRHTTTRSQLYHLGDGIRLIDTPGIREMGLWRMTAEELRFYFPDFEELVGDCKFNNCTHTHEPRCGVRLAMEEGRLSKARYATYVRILESLEDEGP